MTSETPGRAARGRTVRRLRFGLITGLVLLAVGVTAGSSWVVLQIATRTFERRYALELDERLALADEALDRRGRRLTVILEQLATALRGEQKERLKRLLAGGSAAFDEARKMGSIAGLDLLTVIDSTGQVISSKHWPQRAGLNDETLLDLPIRQSVLRRIRGPAESGLALVLRQPLEVSGGPLFLIGGQWLGQGFVDEVAAGRPVLLLDREPAGATRAIASAAEPDSAIWLTEEGSDPRWSMARRILHDDAGQPQGEVLVAVARDEIERLRGQVGIGFLFIGVVASLLAAATGSWIAGRIARPVDRLVEAVDSIAAGQADYTFPSGPGDELDELARAFSGLQRSLELQQQRSAAAERVAAWREVARHVAHEVKNPLAPIRLTVENLIRARREDPRLFEEMFDEGTRTILEEVEQLRKLVGEFSEFARLPPPQRQRVDLHEVIEGVLELFSAEPGLEVRRAFEARPARVEIDPDQIARALKNVVANSVEAMRDGSARGRPGQPRLDVRTANEGGMVTIEISDNGPGLPPDAEGRVFEAYFTTKPQGTGLGMAIAYRIVTEHGGLIAASNPAEGGARVVVRLPNGRTLAVRGEG